MKFLPSLYRFSFILLLFTACEETMIEDSIPPSFLKFQLNPDEVYMYNAGSPLGVRLDPLLNDSIKVEGTITYSNPSNGTIQFVENEGWFYKPNANFIGTDIFNYTICRESTCASAEIKMHVEAPIDLNNCTFTINGETVSTKKDQPIEIRIFVNDIVCPYMGMSTYSPEKGTFNSYSYSGSYKNTVYVYFPPKGFVGTDRFRYRLFTPDGYLETFCNITITE